MQLLALLPFFLLLATVTRSAPVSREVETTCVTPWSGVNAMFLEFEERVRIVDPTFLTTFYGVHSGENCGGVSAQQYSNDILTVIATPDSYCAIDEDGHGSWDCNVGYLPL
ncbi:hypothetical protein MKEN_00162300 [Mycena kentingensis (nom. inval.)]|nr:hypothetical protein MKEN_00162300 [Mycena kentingensis (nom. inval.)]